MPLYDFECCIQFEELCKIDEDAFCPVCNKAAKKIVSRLADYTGINSMTVQYATNDKTDSYITKLPVRVDNTFLQRAPIKQKVY